MAAFHLTWDVLSQASHYPDYHAVMPTRLTFDARGESDLRPAASSHIALVRDHADHEYNPEGQMQPDSSELVAAMRPRGTSLLVDTPGHFQVNLNCHHPAAYTPFVHFVMFWYI